MSLAILTSGGRISRRGATRRSVLLPCQAVRERDFKLLSDRTLDVSVEGMLLPVRDESIVTGDALIVSFPIPGLWIDAEAVVSRVVRGRRPEDDGLAIGVTFTVIGATTRAALAGFLHGRPPPLPRRGPLACLRRGRPAPRLADEELMTRMIAPTLLALEEDVFDDEGDDQDGATPVESGASSSRCGTRATDVDAASVLRALLGAWQSLAVATLPERPESS